LITKCWDAKAENRPTAKELYQKLGEVTRYAAGYVEYEDKIKLNRTSEKRSNNIQTHSQAIYTSRLINFKNLPEPINSGNKFVANYSTFFKWGAGEYHGE
ncbi:hypothetical protein RhiirB3_533221, partial [Rhizophagus irregularis]